MKAIDAIINSIKDRFDQLWFKVFGQVEQLLLKSIKKDSAVGEINPSSFKGSYNPNSLMVELELLPVIQSLQ